MEIEIVGRHALLFDDDNAAAFVNSDDALVDWHSLLIDRYDVRHLLSSPPPSRRRRNPQTSHTSSADAEIDYERYLDLPSPSEEQEADADASAQPEPVGGFNAVPFSYGNYEDSNDQKNTEPESEGPRFIPPFPVPDNLVHNLPPTEKVHQIIARTALFVSKNGGQSEIVLRVKQGDNPTFGFLMPDHHLHAYFRFLIDHQDLLQPKGNKDSENNTKTSNSALSLLGSLYGEDEDGGTEPTTSSKESISLNTMKTMLPAGKDESVSKHSFKEDIPIIKRNSLVNALKSGRTSVVRKGDSSSSLSAVPDKLRASSLPPIPKTEQMLLDPPSDMKPLVEKIVEFVMKNGRHFESVLMEQDRDHGRFPFLIPSNKFHPYYLKVLQKSEESKSTFKSFHNEKEDFRGHVSNKKTSISRETTNSSVESDDIPLDSERKEKFKMVINKNKKEPSDLPPKTTPVGVQVDAAQAAAILQAAQRGIKLPDLGFLSNMSLNGNNNNASKSDSVEAELTHEQKLKSERLKRAKMFVAMLKSGANPSKTEPSRGSSAEPQRSDVDNSDKKIKSEKEYSDVDNLEKKVKSEKEYLDEEKRAKRKYRARTSKDEEHESHDEEEKERKRSHKHRSKKHRFCDYSDEDETEENYEKKKHRSRNYSDEDETEVKYEKKKHRFRNYSDEDETEEKYEKKKHRSRNHSHGSRNHSHDDETEEKYEKKKHRSHRSSHEHNDVDKKKENDHKYSSKKRHRTSSSYEDDEQESEHDVYSRKKRDDEKRKHRSHRSSHHSKDKHKHRKRHSSKTRDQNGADGKVKGSNSEKEDVEDEEVSSKISSQLKSREASVDVSSSYQEQRPPAQRSAVTEVSDDLRAKIRAMLMSTM